MCNFLSTGLCFLLGRTFFFCCTLEWCPCLLWPLRFPLWLSRCCRRRSIDRKIREKRVRYRALQGCARFWMCIEAVLLIPRIICHFLKTIFCTCLFSLCCLACLALVLFLVSIFCGTVFSALNQLFVADGGAWFSFSRTAPSYDVGTDTEALVVASTRLFFDMHRAIYASISSSEWSVLLAKLQSQTPLMASFASSMLQYYARADFDGRSDETQRLGLMWQEVQASLMNLLPPSETTNAGEDPYSACQDDTVSCAWTGLIYEHPSGLGTGVQGDTLAHFLLLDHALGRLAGDLPQDNQQAMDTLDVGGTGASLQASVTQIDLYDWRIESSLSIFTTVDILLCFVSGTPDFPANILCLLKFILPIPFSIPDIFGPFLAFDCDCSGYEQEPCFEGIGLLVNGWRALRSIVSALSSIEAGGIRDFFLANAGSIPDRVVDWFFLEPPGQSPGLNALICFALNSTCVFLLGLIIIAGLALLCAIITVCCSFWRCYIINVLLHWVWRIYRATLGREEDSAAVDQLIVKESDAIVRARRAPVLFTYITDKLFAQEMRGE